MRDSLARKILWGSVRKNVVSSKDEAQIRFLRTFQFFEGLSQSQLRTVSKAFFIRDYRENEYLFEVGQPGAALFVIEEGEVSIEIPKDEANFAQIAVLKEGMFVGELALLDSSPRSASARAMLPTRALALFRNDLNKLILTDPDIAVHIYRGLAKVIGERLKRTNELFDVDHKER